MFISHAWKYTFVEVVDALEHHFSTQPDIFIWFDLFSNNQHAVPNLPMHWLKHTFINTIEQFGRVVMVLCPWNNPMLFTRAWCLWEIYSAVTTGSKFEVAMTPNQYTGFMKEITRNSGEFYQMLGDVNMEMSKAYRSNDKERIFDAVKFSVGFATVNRMVVGKMREWAIAAIDETIDICPFPESLKYFSTDLIEFNVPKKLTFITFSI